jgi:hypothetical protein
LPSGAGAATLTLLYGGQGVYPLTATANSQRWFRCNVTWDMNYTNAGDDKNPVWMINERVVSVELLPENISFNANYGGNMFSTLPVPPNPPHNGARYGVAVDDRSGGGTGNVTFTVGPFSGFNSTYLVGRLQVGVVHGAAGWDINFPFRFRLTYQKWDNGNKVYVTQPAIEVAGPQGYDCCPITPSTGLGASGEVMYWYSSNGAGIDPLAPSGEDPSDPDNGSSSTDYTFKMVYWNFIPGLFPTFRGVTRAAMPAEGYHYCRFENYVTAGLSTGNFDDANKYVALDSDYGDKNRNPYRDWGYGLGAGGHFDYYGSHQSDKQEGGAFETTLSPEALLIIDRNYSLPYYMVDDGHAPTSNGEVYKYEILPTDYLQVFNNLFTFPFDLPGSDRWDMYAELLRERPASNNYVALGPGGHRYEFLVTRDWDPPVAAVVDDATGNTAIGKMMRCICGRPGFTDYAYMDLVSYGAGHFYAASGNDGFGYPYNSQSTKYLKVDPVLAGYPASFQNTSGVGAFSYPYQTEPSAGEPWAAEVGPHTAGLVAPPRLTNDDTIVPNFANTWGDLGVYNPDLTQPSDWRGGKWTTSTNYVFRINYFQSDNLAPQAAQVFIRKTNAAGVPTTGWKPCAMQKVYASDNDYTDGCLYYYQTTAAALPGGGGAGDYQYYFAFSDGRHTTIFPTRPANPPPTGQVDPGSIGVPPGANNFYWFRVNNKPVLSNPGLTPTSGPQGASFVFSTTYADQDGMVGSAAHKGDKPYKSICWIDLFGDVQGQMKVKSIAGSVITYDFVAGSTGSHIPYAADSLVGPQNGQPMQVSFKTGAASNQEFAITANAVVTGGPNGTGTITVNGTPTGVVAGDLLQVVNWYPVNMYQQTPAADDYTKGVAFIFDTARAGMKLDPGVHNYYFEFWDNWAYWINWDQYFMLNGVTPTDLKVEGEMTRLPAAAGSYYEGPTVIANRPPQMSTIYFAPPASDTVSKVVDATHLEYIPPLVHVPYAAHSLTGKFLQLQTGLAALRVYRIDDNTTTQLVVHKVSGTGDLVSDKVALGDTFRVFEDYATDLGLSWAYHMDPTKTFDGTPATGFRLYATYSDADNNAPASIRIAVYSSAAQAAGSPDAVYDLVKVNAANTNYVAGVQYRTAALVSMPPGQHWLRVQANDGSEWAAGGATAADWFGPALHTDQPAVGPVVIVNHPPNPPVSGFSPANRVSVNTAKPTLRWDPATDPDPGDRVVRYTVQLSKTGFAGGAYDYQYQTTSNEVAVTDALSDLTMWSWRVKSEDTLGATSDWSEVQEFFVDLNKAPGVLQPPGGNPNATLSPQTGDLSTVFTYSITYSNADDLPPASGVYVEIDGKLYPTALAKVNPAANDYKAGVRYYIDIRGDSSALGYGKHSYRFYSGAVSWPDAASPAQPGPWIDTASTLSINNSTWTPITQAEEGSTLYFQVTDPDKTKSASVKVAAVAATGDHETVTLNQTAPNSGIFRGSLQTVGKAGPSNNGVLNVEAGADGVQVTVTYTDPDTSGSPKPDVSSATVLIVDTTAPAPVQPYLTVTSGPQGVSLILNWATYPPPDDVAGYHVWLSNSTFNNVGAMTPTATVMPDETSYEILGLKPQTTYYVAVTAFDEVPNENKAVAAKAGKTTDTVGPDLSEETPTPDSVDVALNATVSFLLTDPSGVNLSTIQVLVAGQDVSSKVTKNPSTGTPTSVQVTYQGAFLWNQVVTVRVLSRDKLGNQSDHSWKFSVITDKVSPRVTNLSPAQNASGVSPTDPISFHLKDDVSGLNKNSIHVTLGGKELTAPDLQINSTDLTDVVVTYTAPGGLPAGAKQTVVINATDRAGNAMAPFTWNFTTLYAISGRVTTEGGAGKPGVVVTNGVLSVTTGADGRYTLLGVANGTYTVVPSLQYFGFNPANRRVVVSGASVGGIDFVAIPMTYNISGTINDWSGNPVAGVTVSDGTHTTTTNTQGRYVLSGLLPGSVTLTPTKAQWAFAPASKTVTVPTSDPVDFTAYQSFQTNLPTGTSMVGVPFDPLDRTASTVFGTGTLARWNPQGSPPAYVKPGDPGSEAVLEVRPSRGYFVSYRAPHTLAGAGIPVDASAPYVISLGPMWNMIANPFAVRLPVANLKPALPKGADPYVFVYDRDTNGYLFVSATPGLNVARTYLNPWEGAWLRSLVGVTSVTATVEAGVASAEVEPQSLAIGEGGYVMPVVARAGNLADQCSACGIRPEGAYEIANPPMLPGSVDLYFLDDAGNPLAQQLKPPSAGPQSWKFVVATDLPKADISVGLPDLSQVPNDLSVMLVDEDAGRTLYMRTLPQYTFRSGAEGAVRHFRLEVTPRGTDNLVIGAASAQQTGAGVVVSYSVSAPCQVTIQVFNVAGRVVRRLTAGSVVAAGVNQQTWNLRGDSGAAVPSGMYLVRVDAVADNGQRVQAIAPVNVAR